MSVTQDKNIPNCRGLGSRFSVAVAVAVAFAVAVAVGLSDREAG